MNRNYFSLAIKILLATSVIILMLNFVCAKGGGVQILALLGQVTTEQTIEKKYIYEGVDLMQWIIKIVALIGISSFIFCLYNGWKKLKKSELD